jgi:hypothetical protein
VSENLLDEIYRAKDQLRNAVHTSTGRHLFLPAWMKPRDVEVMEIAAELFGDDIEIHYAPEP